MRRRFVLSAVLAVIGAVPLLVVLAVLGDRSRALDIYVVYLGALLLMALARITAGEQEGAGTYNGRPFARKTRYLRLYLKRGGRWQNVAAQSALIAP